MFSARINLIFYFHKFKLQTDKNSLNTIKIMSTKLNYIPNLKIELYSSEMNYIYYNSHKLFQQG